MSGAWLPGLRIPPEHHLMEQYGCSRMTVNKALSTLVEKGLIERRKRAGTFVSPPQVHRAALDFPDVRSEILGDGKAYRYELLHRVIRDADEADRRLLDSARARVLALQCLHFADDRPFMVEDRLINLDLVPQALDCDFSREPPGAWMLAHVPWGDARHRITAIAAPAALAARLAIDPGAPCLSIERWTWQTAEKLTYVRQVYPGAAKMLDAVFRP